VRRSRRRRIPALFGCDREERVLHPGPRPGAARAARSARKRTMPANRTLRWTRWRPTKAPAPPGARPRPPVRARRAQRRLHLDTASRERLHHRGAGFLGRVAAHQERRSRGPRRRGRGLSAGGSAGALHLPPKHGGIHVRVDLQPQAALAFFLLEHAIAAHKALAAVGERCLDLCSPGAKGCGSPPLP